MTTRIRLSMTSDRASTKHQAFASRVDGMFTRKGRLQSCQTGLQLTRPEGAPTFYASSARTAKHAMPQLHQLSEIRQFPHGWGWPISSIIHSEQVPVLDVFVVMSGLDTCADRVQVWHHRVQ